VYRLRLDRLRLSQWLLIKELDDWLSVPTVVAKSTHIELGGAVLFGRRFDGSQSLIDLNICYEVMFRLLDDECLVVRY